MSIPRRFSWERTDLYDAVEGTRNRSQTELLTRFSFMTRHLILAICAAVMLLSCKTGPRENAYPRLGETNIEVQRNNFYQGRQVAPQRVSASPQVSRSELSTAPETASTPTPAPEPAPVSTPTPAPEPTPAPQTATSSEPEERLPFGKPVPGKPGYVTSPYSPDAGYIDVTGFESGSKARDPYTNKIFRVP